MELDAQNFRMARLNTSWCRSRTILVNAAVWSSCGPLSYGGEDTNAYNVSGPLDGEGFPCPRGRAAEGMTVDAIITLAKVERVGFLKMDIEGAEEEVLLRGDTGWLDRVDSTKIELHADTYREISHVLKSHDFLCGKDSGHWNCVNAQRVPPRETPLG